MTSVPAAQLVFVDIEVAGAEISRPIIQVAAIAVAANLEELETFEAKLKFDERLADHKTLTRNRYCEKTWTAEARSATSVARAFASFLRRHATFDLAGNGRSSYRVAQLVAHNANFDGPFLRAWFDRVGDFLPGDYRILCTVQRAMWLFHEHCHLRPPADFKLGTLCRYFGVPLDPNEAHTALADVRATVELYRRITLLATAESCNRIGARLVGARPITRVGRVAARSQEACRSRRSREPKACRSRRRRCFKAGR
jgi:DNA polymerase III alpha subunit (gram-positive type)